MIELKQANNSVINSQESTKKRNRPDTSLNNSLDQVTDDIVFFIFIIFNFSY